jgi:sRNA-binding carbon storage regulator CsrA
MLVISRKVQESIRIEPAVGLDPLLTLREVFQDRPIIFTLVHVGHRRVRLMIDAPAPLKVWRSDPGQLEDRLQSKRPEQAAGHTATVPTITRAWAK